MINDTFHQRLPIKSSSSLFSHHACQKSIRTIVNACEADSWADSYNLLQQVLEVIAGILFVDEAINL